MTFYLNLILKGKITFKSYKNNFQTFITTANYDYINDIELKNCQKFLLKIIVLSYLKIVIFKFIVVKIINQSGKHAKAFVSKYESHK